MVWLGPSLTLYSEEGYLIPNQNRTYSVSSQQKLHYREDGTVHITISMAQPQDLTATNWLSAPQVKCLIYFALLPPLENCRCRLVCTLLTFHYESRLFLTTIILCALIGGWKILAHPSHLLAKRRCPIYCVVAAGTEGSYLLVCHRCFHYRHWSDSTKEY